MGSTARCGIWRRRRREKEKEKERERDREREREREGFGEWKACGLHRGGKEGGRDEKTKSNCSKFMDRVAAMKTPRQSIQVNLGKH
ncbi:hypothetical protein D8674_031829 [Pyrus ussuriensis x Pyrus communis]|uniref:Uncharacterized protein n=1 Tax=Pyrus ussuriensis x Pyrus communis TaxID=2448454 RepID=A0A5N5EZT4_9ROSA|nr:hypothetical protein D8674_031829 [Pyrus ussuriensis x Pyrus communis]